MKNKGSWINWVRHHSIITVILGIGIITAGLIIGCSDDVRVKWFTPWNAGHRNQQRQEITLQFDPFDWLAPAADSYQGSWKAFYQSHYISQGINLVMEIQSIQPDQKTTYHLWINNAELPQRQLDQSGYPLEMVIQRASGALTLHGNSQEDISGSFTFHPDTGFLKSLAALLDKTPTAQEAIEIWSRDLSLDYARDIKNALEDERFNLNNILHLARYGISPQYITDLNNHDYRLPVNDIIKLNRYGISPAFAGSYKTAGYAFNVDELINVNRYGLKASEFVAFRDAGYDFDIDTMIKADRYGISPGDALKFKSAGYDFNLDELIEVDRYGLKPEGFIAFRHAGYDFDIDTMIKADRYGIKPDNARQFKEAGCDYSLDDLIELDRYGIKPDYVVPLRQAGYNFSLNDLKKLDRYGVSVEFILALTDPDYERFTADEIINFKNHNISIDTIKKIRKKKKAVTDH